MKSETLPEELANDLILAIDMDRWETVGVLPGQRYDFSTDPFMSYMKEEAPEDE